MAFITPADGQPAIAEHVAQLTQALSGVRAEPITLTADLTLSEATPSVGLKLTADTQPRARLTDTALAFGPGGSTAPDTTLTRTGAQQLASNSTLTLTPAGGQDALALAAGGIIRGATTLTLAGQTGDINFSARNSASGGYVQPALDNVTNLGGPSARWGTVYASVGAISTSVAEAKADALPLDPAACLRACQEVVWFDFRYTSPPPPEAPEAQARYAASLAETAPARHQRGFIFPEAQPREGEPALPPVPELFGLDDRVSTTPQADLATVACGMQELIRQVEALVARVAALEAAG